VTTDPVVQLEHEAVVIGGGLAGLTAARELLRHGVKPLVLEASQRVGGYLSPLKIALDPGHEITVDAGAESFAARDVEVADYIAGLGLDVVQPSPRSAWCFPSSGAPFPLPKTSVLGVPSDWTDPALAAALGAEGVERARADEWMNVAIGDRSNLAAFVASRMGQDVVERLVRPIAGGVHSADPGKLDVTALHPRFWEIFESAGSLTEAVREIRAAAPAGSAVSGIRGGMNQLVSTLAEQISGLGGTIAYGKAVSGLARAGNGWKVTIEGQHGDSSAIKTSRVVLALPVKQAIELLKQIGATPPDAQQDVPQGTDISLVTLVVDAAQLADRGTGGLIAPGGAISAKGTTHVNSKWPWVQELLPEHTHVIRFSYGRHGEPADQSDQELIAQTRADFEQIYEPLTYTVHTAHVQRWPNALAPVTPQMKTLSTAVAEQVDGLPGLAVTGAWMSGTGVVAVIPHTRKAVLGIV
jgi:oxygen-dependent protoporphyrinogen oxidase